MTCKRTILLVSLVWAVIQGSACIGVEKAAAQGDPEARLAQIGIELYEPPPRTGNYAAAVRTGSLVYVAGHGPRRPEGGYVVGKVGIDLDLEQAQEAARLTVIDMLSSLKAEIGDLKKVERIVKVTGMVNAIDSFGDHPQVMNGASDLLVELFGERGKHARSSVGVSSLPIGTPVEIDMVVEVR